ncbi:hypothetical protein [Acetobacter nitrogenifigens]|nr:hypothetical protein [Acetobacter nitrogenifigens]
MRGDQSPVLTVAAGSRVDVRRPGGVALVRNLVAPDHADPRMKVKS